MTYAAEETGTQSGAPVELYTFDYGASAYRYTSRESSFTDTTVSPNRVYTSASIDRTPIESTQEEARNALKLTVARDFAVADLFRVAPPSDPINVTVRRVHRGDTTSMIVIWVGRVLNCVFEGARAVLTCEPITVSLARTGLRRLYGIPCPYALYGQGCGLTKATYANTKRVLAVSGLTVTVGSLPAGFSFDGGFVEWVDDDGNTQRRFIESRSGPTGSPEQNVLTLTQAFTGLAVTSPLQSITVYPGCDHTLATCNSVYSNAANYGGWPFIPSKNPFRGDPVY